MPTPIKRRQAKVQGEKDPWVTVSWTEVVNGKETQMSRSVRNSELERSSRAQYEAAKTGTIKAKKKKIGAGGRY